MISVAIPNFNYGRYIREAVSSALHEPEVAEVVIADNASTDDSITVCRAITDKRVRLIENTVNVGFARNVDRAVGATKCTWVMVLCSDDSYEPGALRRYRAVVDAADASGLGDAVLTGGRCTTDEHGATLTYLGRNRAWWPESSLDPELSAAAGVSVYRQPASELLRRSLLAMRNPFPFATTCYRRSTWERTRGYSGRLINPDKWFAWQALALTDWVVWIDDPVARYRVHPGNQTTQAKAIGALKYLVDEYAMTLELSPDELRAAGVSRTEMQHAFVVHDCILRALVLLKEGQHQEARRFLAFAKATYPRLAKSQRVLAQILCAGGPAGSRVARAASAVLEHR